MVRRLLVAIFTVVAIVLAFAPVRVAAAEWCDTDPLVLISTPGGALVPVYVTNGALGAEHLATVQLATMTYSVQPTADGSATLVHLDVRIPDDVFASHFATRSVASSGPLATGTSYANASGFSGQTMTLTFTLNVP
ncbi:MAG: hypothetical protein ACTHMU_23730 [Thermomicrobiales bacterium]|nr:hypothetical protein [Thermomicrobiales bacterium]